MAVFTLPNRVLAVFTFQKQVLAVLVLPKTGPGCVCSPWNFDCVGVEEGVYVCGGEEDKEEGSLERQLRLGDEGARSPGITFGGSNYTVFVRRFLQF